MFRSTSFEKYIENATSHLHLEPDWPTIILICDAIRQNDISPKNALALLKKKMFSSNPHTAMYALIVLESIVKNCGAPIHDEISSKTNCEMFSSLIAQTGHENVRNKMLELIQCWAYAFRSTPKYRAIKDTMNILKTEGRTFPKLEEADAMFTSDTAPDWADGEVCDRCRTAFSFTLRKHHCRNCGQVFCGQCSSKTSTLPKYGIEKEVRVCDGCFETLQKPSANAKPASASTDLPAIYLSSTLAQQSQTPVRKTEAELKEEEELQLALALSQSEAEEAEKKKFHGPQRSSTVNSSSSSSSFTKSSYSPPRRAASPVSPPPVAHPTPEESDPELARYLNRNYWEQQKQVLESPVSPSAPIINTVTQLLTNTKLTDTEVEIEDFSQTMRSQVEIFVNRMKSNSSRGRNISNDSSVQTLFMNLTSHHSKLLTYIKSMDDKRMWYEQLQDKLAQVKDSRAALDVLRQEHQEKLRRQAEEMEHQRQMQMAQKLEIMRKKKQEFLQYQRQMAVHRIQEQEREMQMRQEQQKTQYMMQFSGVGVNPQSYSSPQQQQQQHQMGGGGYPGYGQQQQQQQQQLPMGMSGPGQQMGGYPANQMGPGMPMQMGHQFGGQHQHHHHPPPSPHQMQHQPHQLPQGQSGGPMVEHLPMMPPGGGMHPPQMISNSNMPGMDPNMQHHHQPHQQHVPVGMAPQPQPQPAPEVVAGPIPGQNTQMPHNPVAAPPHQQQQQVAPSPVVVASPPAPPVVPAAEPVAAPPVKNEDLPMAELISFD